MAGLFTCCQLLTKFSVFFPPLLLSSPFSWGYSSEVRDLILELNQVLGGVVKFNSGKTLNYTQKLGALK